MKLVTRQTNLTVFQEAAVQAGVFLVIFLLGRVGWSGVVIQNLQTTLAPVSEVVASSILLIERPFYSFNHMYSSAAELSIVKEKYAASLAELGELERLKVENQQLRQMIENRHLSLSERVIATPVASYAYPAVAAGLNQGVRAGGLVMVADTLLGRITSTELEESRVQLLSSQDAQPVLAQTQAGVQGLVKGNGRAVLLTQLPPDITLTAGERVVTLGQPGIKPGVFIGVIAADQVQGTAATKTVVLDQLVSFYTTPLVEIW